MIYLLCKLHSKVVNFVPKITVKDFDARMISRGLESRPPSIPIYADKIHAAVIHPDTIPRYFGQVLRSVRWDITNVKIVIWFWTSLLYLFSHLLIHRREPAAAQH